MDEWVPCAQGNLLSLVLLMILQKYRALEWIHISQIIFVTEYWCFERVNLLLTYKWNLAKILIFNDTGRYLIREMHDQQTRKEKWNMNMNRKKNNMNNMYIHQNSILYYIVFMVLFYIWKESLKQVLDISITLWTHASGACAYLYTAIHIKDTTVILRVLNRHSIAHACWWELL